MQILRKLSCNQADRRCGQNWQFTMVQNFIADYSIQICCRQSCMLLNFKKLSKKAQKFWFRAASCKKLIRKNKSTRKNKLTRKHIFRYKICFLVSLFFLVNLFFSYWLLHEAAPNLRHFFRKPLSSTLFLLERVR